MIEIVLNGSRRQITATTIASMLDELGDGTPMRGVAVARNGAVVPRSRWSEESLAAGDEVEFVTAVQGG